jgi:hypothetical protein
MGSFNSEDDDEVARIDATPSSPPVLSKRYPDIGHAWYRAVSAIGCNSFSGLTGSAART